LSGPSPMELRANEYRHDKDNGERCIAHTRAGAGRQTHLPSLTFTFLGQITRFHWLVVAVTLSGSHLLSVFRTKLLRQVPESALRYGALPIHHSTFATTFHFPSIVIDSYR
jgi:hypothetical protein